MGRVGGNIDGASVCGALIAGAASRRFSHADFLQVQCAALPAARQMSGHGRPHAERGKTSGAMRHSWSVADGSYCMLVGDSCDPPLGMLAVPGRKPRTETREQPPMHRSYAAHGVSLRRIREMY